MPQQTIDGITWNYFIVNNSAFIGDGVSGSTGSATTEGHSLAGPVTIPDNLGGVPVRDIHYHAFMSCSLLTEVTIPASVSIISYGAFQYCSSLTSVIFTGSSVLETIGMYAFSNSGLPELDIPTTVTEIRDNAFRGCSSLSRVNFSELNNLETIGEKAFVSCILITDPITLPSSLQHIGSEAFAFSWPRYLTNNLSSITFNSGSLTAIGSSIGTNAFKNSGLETIYALPDTIHAMSWTIGSNTLYGTTFNVVELVTAEIPICFPKGTPVLTNLGPVAIEKLNPDKHSIRGKEIVAITQSRPLQKHIVCFGKDALSKNVPSQQTLCSMEHKVFYKGEMTKARNLVDLCENVTFVDYNGETLFNVLLKKHDKMMINNLICETLHPDNIAAKISTMKDGQKKNKAIQELTKIIKENNVPEYQKLYASL